jgi:Na+-translocating ferredoxin:NAD+ oxidoreductase subunit B
MSNLMDNMVAISGVSPVIMAGAVLLAMGLFFAVILIIANAKLAIEQDPTVAAVLAVLPGANCGGCGLAGCGAYAEAVVANHGLMGKCGPGGEALVKKIAAIFGIEVAASAPVRAVVHCSAKTGDRINKNVYIGVASCAEARIIAGVTGCSYGCMGYGDCVAACNFDAIKIIDSLATVDYGKCVGCGACVKACPRNMIEMLAIKEDPMMVIACSSLDKAKEVRGYCKVGCIGCGLCAKQAPEMFRIERNLSVIDYDHYGSRQRCDEARGKCPRDMMIYVGTKKDIPVSQA